MGVVFKQLSNQLKPKKQRYSPLPKPNNDDTSSSRKTHRAEMMCTEKITAYRPKPRSEEQCSLIFRYFNKQKITNRDVIMPNGPKIYSLLKEGKKNQGSPFFSLPKELIEEITLHSYYNQSPESDIAMALHYAAYAREEEVAKLVALLEKNPRLLLEAGDVKTPGGDEIPCVTLYEFLLGAGDGELAHLMHPFFEKIDGGEEERLRQYERYKSYIDGMLTQQPYDLTSLIELIKQATPQEITALLNKDMSGDTALCQAMRQFRKDWAPKIMTKPCMHYNYASLQHAFQLLTDEWDNLHTASGNNLDKINLVWRQLIGFEMRRLPGIDRCMMAQGLCFVRQNKPVLRSYSFWFDVASPDFPITVADDSPEGLGSDYSVSILGRAQRESSYVADATGCFERLSRRKVSNLQSLYNHTKPSNLPAM